jgi:sodium/bile acid cotransporter 7
MSSGSIAAVRRFLPDPFTCGLVVTLVAASLWPANDAVAPAVSTATDVAITVMFFLYGAKLAPSRVVEGIAHWRLQSLIFAATWLLFPLLGLGLARLLPGVLSHDLVVGLVFLTLLPSTVQSSLAFTSIAGGNLPAAMCAATFSNIAGTVLTPLWVGLALSLQGDADTWSAIGQIVRLIVVPFAVGQVLRPWLAGWVSRNGRLLAITDRGSILLIVYGAIGKAVRLGIWSRLAASDLAVVVVVEAALLAGMIFVIGRAARRIGLPRADEIAAIFCGAKKSLATGVPMAGVLFAPEQAGLVLVPVMLFHQMELMTGAWLSRRYARRQASVAASTEPVGVAVAAESG